MDIQVASNVSATVNSAAVNPGVLSKHWYLSKLEFSTFWVYIQE